ncbi:MAG: hypothetical protein ACD_79C00050G0002 [uncultured bacterium]|nr:MAG: hypothetical protein ACD_79C00050G0002 [uncultured bacterium]
MTDLNKVRELNTSSLSINGLNQLLEHANIEVSFTGKRTITISQPYYSLQNPYYLCKTSFEILSNALVINLQKYPITAFRNIENMTFFDKFDLTTEQEIDKYKDAIRQATEVLDKITRLESSSKNIIKKSNIITRIFFFFTQLFQSAFYCNLKKTSKLISAHETILLQKEKLLEPVKQYHTITKSANVTGGLMSAFSGIFYLSGITIPYVSPVLNLATAITVMKIAYGHMNNAINNI